MASWAEREVERALAYDGEMHTLRSIALAVAHHAIEEAMHRVGAALLEFTDKDTRLAAIEAVESMLIDDGGEAGGG
jgi:hypothetical protein